VTVGADQPDVIEGVVHRITVFMVHLKRRRPAPPLGYAADLAMPAAFINQVVFQQRSANRIWVYLNLLPSSESKLTSRVLPI
jgi:hypothetical protein